MEPEVPEAEVPEVIVRSTRRHRTRTAPPQLPSPPNVRNWLIYIALAVGTIALMVDGFLTDTPTRQVLPSRSQALEVSSTIDQLDDSLQVVISWELTLSDSEGTPDSVRIRVGSKQLDDTLVMTQPASQLADTAYLPPLPPGQTVSGISCVAAKYPEEPLQENCTPWQYVRPLATTGTPPRQIPVPQATTGAIGTPVRIVVQPSGLQVDPDVDGKCAEWQRTHPSESVWVQVNSIAVYQCMGPNKKPVVAQFCAFGVLPDGRRVKMANSINNTYCDELFEEWIRERYS